MQPCPPTSYKPVEFDPNDLQLTIIGEADRAVRTLRKQHAEETTGDFEKWLRGKIIVISESSPLDGISDKDFAKHKYLYKMHEFKNILNGMDPAKLAKCETIAKVMYVLMQRNGALRSDWTLFETPMKSLHLWTQAYLATSKIFKDPSKGADKSC